jgi:hypothetical protein
MNGRLVQQIQVPATIEISLEAKLEHASQRSCATVQGQFTFSRSLGAKLMGSSTR